MIIRKPTYYDSFHCIASSCPDSCCQDWAVAVDEDTRRKYEAMTGSLGSDIRRYLMEEDGEWIIQTRENGRCPMWRLDGLCRIQAEQGEQALCQVCKQFPRLTHDYGEFQEWGLELSCPEAARIILTAPRIWKEEAVPGGESGDYDYAKMDLLLCAREKTAEILRNPGYSTGEALAVAMLYGYHVQTVLDGGESSFSEASALESARTLAKAGEERDIRQFFKTLNILRPHWKARLEEPERNGELPEELRLLAVYFADRYYLQAVADSDLLSRVKLMVVSCLLIASMEGDLLRSAQEYSKEIENDAENVEALLNAAYTERSFADTALICRLLKDNCN